MAAAQHQQIRSFCAFKKLIYTSWNEQNLGKQMKFCIAIGVFVNVAIAGLSPAQKQAIHDAAVEADASIDHISPLEIKSRAHQGTWLLFFGAKWCRITQK